MPVRDKSMVSAPPSEGDRHRDLPDLSDYNQVPKLNTGVRFPVPAQHISVPRTRLATRLEHLVSSERQAHELIDSRQA